ncbi:hypothetical protein FOC4_g10000606, partial [Fusarium odoratissimum]
PISKDNNYNFNSKTNIIYLISTFNNYYFERGFYRKIIIYYAKVLIPNRQLINTLGLYNIGSLSNIIYKGGEFRDCCYEKGYYSKNSMYYSNRCQSEFGTCSSVDESSTTTTAMHKTLTSITASLTHLDVASVNSTSTSIAVISTDPGAISTSSLISSLSVDAEAGIAVGSVIGGIGAIGLLPWLIIRRKNKISLLLMTDGGEVKHNNEPRYELHGETSAKLPAGYKNYKR